MRIVMIVERSRSWILSLLLRWGRGVVLSVLILLTGVAVEAREVSRKEAERFAAQWIQRENARPEQRVTRGPFSLAITRELIEDGDLVGYVVDLEPSGFLIIPAFTELSPVKLASFSGRFQDLADHPFIKELRMRLIYTANLLGYLHSPANPRLMMQGKAEQVDAEQIKVNESVWNDIATPGIRSVQGYATEYDTGTFVAPLTASTWDQGDPYSLKTPIIDGNHTLTGCVATAMAQVMYFWRYPNAGQGTHTYTWHGLTLTANFAHAYDWANMKDSYTGGEQDAEKAAVATLMSDAGIAVNMNYGLSGSGAQTEEWETVLESYFKYNPEARTVYRNSYASWSDWFLVLKGQMDLARPTLLSIDPPSGGTGHAVVVDGYRVQDGINQVHVNMGWGGAADNYYAMDDISGYGNAFSDLAAIDIHPSEHFVYTPAAPIGISVGQTGSAYEFEDEPSRDSDSDAIEYSFSWGDGSSSPWSPTSRASHAWSAQGTYAVTIRARCASHPEMISSPSFVKTVVIGDSLFGTERGALIDFYLSTDGDHWAHNNNWKKPDGSFNDPGTEGSWYGVDVQLGHVTGISMFGNISKGFIPPSFGDLKFLRVLYLNGCGLSGHIPDSIGNLTNLVTASFFGNRLEGSIPDGIGNLTKLSELNFYGNRLTGIIPESLANLGDLRILELTGNQLTGPIPSIIGNLRKLSSLRLAGNQISGPIPDHLGELTNLTELVLSFNNLSGPIPAALGNLTQLTGLSLETNHLNGAIPTELSGLVNLNALWLGANDLSGSIPSAIGNLTNLSALGIHGNQLSGSLPSSLGNLTKLTYLDLGANNLTGSIPPELSALADLTRLQIDANKITGPIPKELGNLHKLTNLYIHDNELSGSIPGELGGIDPHADFYVQNNHLSGSIPKEIFNLTHTSYFYLHGNMFSGEIPAEVLNLADLSTLSCGHPRINNNALYTSNPAVIDFLNAHFQAGWDSSQTVAPNNLAVQILTSTSVRLSWTPIAYKDYSGGYRVFIAQQPGGAWIEAGMTADKRASSFTVLNLLPGTEYSFFVRTQTDAHETDTYDMNKNTVVSEPSEIVSINSINPRPIISNISPSSATAGGSAFTLTVNGSGFSNGAAVNWNSTALTTTYVRGTQLTATAGSNLIASAGTATITVTSGSVTSTGALFTINPGPSITITTNPAGRSITVDGVTYTAPLSFSWTAGSSHVIATTTLQGAGGTRYVFANWSDGGAISHTIAAPTSATTYTAGFTTQYFLTGTASPTAGGSIVANPTSSDGYYTNGTTVQLTASPNSGYAFSSWTGEGCSGTGTCQVTMAQTRYVIATFDSQTLRASLQSSAYTGMAPLTVTITATAGGTATGAINYTFYKDRSDSGTNVTMPYDAKYDGTTTNPQSATLTYSSAGTYTARIIIERGGAPPAEARIIITVASAQPMSTYNQLLLIYPNSDVIYFKGSVAQRFKGSMGTELKTTVINAFKNLPNLIKDGSADAVSSTYAIVEIQNPITQISTYGDDAYWLSPANIQDDLKLYAPQGQYDSVHVVWNSGPINTPFGLGGAFINDNTATFDSMIAGQDWWWIGAGEAFGEPFLHEWLVGVCNFYQQLGFEMPKGNADGAASHGYSKSSTEGWMAYYRDLMRGKVFEPAKIRNTGIAQQAWVIGTPRGGFAYFEDVPLSQWAFNYVSTIYNADITTGYGGTSEFKPDLNVTRDQMAAFIIRAKEGEPAANYCDSGTSFPDVSASAWSCGYVKRLSELKVTLGYGGTNQYRPELIVTRDQMAAFIIRAIEGEPPADYCSNGSPFSDVSPADWSCRYIKRLYEWGITTGYGGTDQYRPELTVTRAQMSAFLARAFLSMK